MVKLVDKCANKCYTISTAWPKLPEWLSGDGSDDDNEEEGVSSRPGYVQGSLLNVVQNVGTIVYGRVGNFVIGATHILMCV